MFSAIVITAVVVGSLGYALRSGRDGDLIIRRPYNNRYNDASGARDYTLWE
jgi:hypothetical protein